MDMTITNHFHWTMNFLTELFTKLGLNYNSSILNIGYEFKNCHLQICLAKCIFIFFCRKKLPLKSMVATSLPIICFFALSGVIIGKILPGLLLFCWWTSVLYLAYYDSEAVAFTMLTTFTMLFARYRFTVSLLVLACGISVWRRGMFHIRNYAKRRQALSNVLTASAIGMMCGMDMLSEYVAAPIFIIMTHRIIIIYIPKLSNWYLIAAIATYVSNLLVYLYYKLTMDRSLNSENV